MANSKGLTLHHKAERAKKRSRALATADKNQLLQYIKDEIERESAAIMSANREDLERAHTLSLPFKERLSLEGRIEGILTSIDHVVSLPSPLGEVLDKRVLPSGLTLEKVRFPLGLIGVIYESRPNVTIEIAVLCLKTGNAALMRGGSETECTNRALMKALHTALHRAGLPTEILTPLYSREEVDEMLRCAHYVDMIIPRGGTALQNYCLEKSTVPVITGGIGICHLYLDASARLDHALNVINNAKTDRPSVCNALDTLLVHKDIAPQCLPLLHKKLKGVSFKVDQQAATYIEGERATEDDWKQEWLNLTLGVKVVASIEEAIEHIQTYSSGHSDGILSETEAHIQQFIQAIDTAAIYVNASTRFTDGGEFGLGAEVAVSTQKLHARGPMGIDSLTTYRWILRGNYTVRS